MARLAADDDDDNDDSDAVDELWRVVKRLFDGRQLGDPLWLQLLRQNVQWQRDVVIVVVVASGQLGQPSLVDLLDIVAVKLFLDAPVCSFFRQQRRRRRRHGVTCFDFLRDARRHGIVTDVVVFNGTNQSTFEFGAETSGERFDEKLQLLVLRKDVLEPPLLPVPRDLGAPEAEERDLLAMLQVFQRWLLSQAGWFPFRSLFSKFCYRGGVLRKLISLWWVHPALAAWQLFLILKSGSN